MNDIDQFKEILKFSSICKNINLKKFNHIIPKFIIKSDFILHETNDINEVQIHFNYRCTGSNKFKKLLKKFNLKMEWYDNYTLLLF